VIRASSVTNLEPVAKNLQEVLHESRVEILALQVENTRLRSRYVEQEKLWRTTWQSNAGEKVEFSPQSATEAE
jgi:regulator of replication initiation timing